MTKTISRNSSIKNGVAKFEDAVSLTGFGKFNIIILLASGGCLMVVIIETMAMMMIVPASQCDLELSLSTKGLLSAISFLGVVSSSHLWGFIADTRGRRNVLIISMVASFITSLTSSIVPEAWIFILIRFINGFFVGGASAVVYAYVGEFHDSTYRPKVVSWIATFVAFGNMIIPGFAWLILPLNFSIQIPLLEIVFRSWRLLVICYGSPALIFAIWLMKLPESPKYLLAQGKLKEALDILKYVFAMNTGKNPEDFPVKELKNDEIVSEIEGSQKAGIFKSMWMQTALLFKTPYILKTFMVCLLQFGAFFSSSGFIMWYPEVLNRMASYGILKPNETVSICKAIDFYSTHKNLMRNVNEEVLDICIDSVETDVFQTSLFIGLSFAIIYILIGTFINIVGAKRLVIIFLIITTACGLASQYMTSQLTAEALMGIFLTEATCVGIINAIVVELYPTQLRAMALAISLMAGRFGAVTGANISGPLIYQWCEYVFYAYGIDHIILIITIFLLPNPPAVKKMIEPNV